MNRLLPNSLILRLRSGQAVTIPRRWLILLVLLGALPVLGFYTVTDNSRLAHNYVLDGADYAGYAICHRISDRSFTVAGRQLPLCARCTGIYLGIALTFVILTLSGRWRWSELPPLPILLILLGFIGVMGIDGINSYSHFFPNFPHAYEPRNWLRLVTGMGTGLAMGSIIFPALAQTLWRDQELRSSLGSFAELFGLVIVATVAIFLVLSNQPTILYVMALVSAAGVVLILTAINSMALLLLIRRDAQAASWQQAAVPLMLGLVFAIVQIGVVSLLRYSLTGTMTGFPGL